MNNIPRASGDRNHKVGHILYRVFKPTRQSHMDRGRPPSAALPSHGQYPMVHTPKCAHGIHKGKTNYISQATV